MGEIINLNVPYGCFRRGSGVESNCQPVWLRPVTKGASRWHKFEETNITDALGNKNNNNHRQGADVLQQALEANKEQQRSTVTKLL